MMKIKIKTYTTVILSYILFSFPTYSQIKKHILHIGTNLEFINKIDFDTDHVTLITDNSSVNTESKEIKKFASVKKLVIPNNVFNTHGYHDAQEQIETLADELAAEFGTPHAIVGLFEHVTLPASILRKKYGIKGVHPETAELFRDKAKMKLALHNSPVEIPKFIDFSNINSTPKELLFSIFNESDSIVIKPKAQSGAQGIKIFSNLQECIAYIDNLDMIESYEAEEYIDGTLLHFDGVIRDNQLCFFSVSEYLYNCFEVVHLRKALASYNIDNKELFLRVEKLGENVLKTFGLTNGVFHGEVFLTPDNRLVFLEIANRISGGATSATLEKTYGFSLVKEGLALERKDPSPYTGLKRSIDHKVIGAYVYPALPTTKPSSIKSINGLERLPTSVIDFITPQVGSTINTFLAHFPASGKFILNTSSSKQAREDAQVIIDEYSITVESL